MKEKAAAVRKGNSGRGGLREKEQKSWFLQFEVFLLTLIDWFLYNANVYAFD